MTGRGWFQLRLSTVFAMSLVASVLLGANLTNRVELQPLSLSIGRGDSSVPVQAFFSRTVRGWPFDIDNADPLQKERITQNAAASCLILLLATLICELWVRRRERDREAAHTKDLSIAGLQLSFITGVLAIGTIVWMLWHNIVLALDGPFAVRGWPLQFQSFVRAEAVITREAIKQWDYVNNNSILWLAANVLIGAISLCGIFFLSRVYRRRRLNLSKPRE